MLPQKGSISVLLIDSSGRDRDYYTQHLKKLSPDYEVLQAATGQAGLELFASNTIDCVVLEIDLPDMSGFEVLLKLVPIVRSPQVAVVILTHLTNPALHELALKNGARAALCKTRSSGDDLDTAVLKATAIVQVDRKRKERVGTGELLLE